MVEEEEEEEGEADETVFDSVSPVPPLLPPLSVNAEIDAEEEGEGCSAREEERHIEAPEEEKDCTEPETRRCARRGRGGGQAAAHAQAQQVRSS